MHEGPSSPRNVIPKESRWTRRIRTIFPVNFIFAGGWRLRNAIPLFPVRNHRGYIVNTTCLLLHSSYDRGKKIRDASYVCARGNQGTLDRGIDARLLRYRSCDRRDTTFSLLGHRQSRQVVRPNRGNVDIGDMDLM